jgi:hypothetical protein
MDTLKQFSAKAATLKDSLKNEESTKTALIMPFFAQVLGFDVFNPYEFCPEYVADVGAKKGEKVDYALLFDGKPVIIVEAKWCGVDDLHLDKHGGQLFRYFATNVDTRFGILTNGVVYKFFTDLKDENVMDMKPFLEIDLLNIREPQAPELKRFRKSYFNADEVFDRAEELRYSGEIRTYFLDMLENPSDDFIRFMGRACYEGKITLNVLDKLRPIVHTTLNALVEEQVKDRLERALTNAKEKQSSSEEQPAKEAAAESETPGKIITTEEEIQAYGIVKGILCDLLDPERIFYKDTENYFAILYDNKVTKWLCRLYLDGKKKLLVIPPAAVPPFDKEARYTLDSVNSLYVCRESLRASAQRFVDQEKE